MIKSLLSFQIVTPALPAIGHRLAAIGHRLAAIGYRLSAIGHRPSGSLWTVYSLWRKKPSKASLLPQSKCCTANVGFSYSPIASHAPLVALCA